MIDRFYYQRILILVICCGLKDENEKWQNHKEILFKSPGNDEKINLNELKITG